MVAAITTYMVILIQFMDKDEEPQATNTTLSENITAITTLAATTTLATIVKS
jgi:hypothetical protein